MLFKREYVHVKFSLIKSANFEDFYMNFFAFELRLDNKTQLFWEGHKNLRHPLYGFDIYLLSKRQIHKENVWNFRGLLRKAEL